MSALPSLFQNFHYMYRLVFSVCKYQSRRAWSFCFEWPLKRKCRIKLVLWMIFMWDVVCIQVKQFNLEDIRDVLMRQVSLQNKWINGMCWCYQLKLNCPVSVDGPFIHCVYRKNWWVQVNLVPCICVVLKSTMDVEHPSK